MAALSGQQILERLEEPDDLTTRIVVSPLLEPDEQLRSDQASIDVRLGFEFALVAPSSYGSIDEFGSGTQAPISGGLANLYRKQYVPFGQGITIHPHQFILAVTLEYIRLPQGVMAYVVGRSTWGRLGLIVATAIGVQPGFAGSLTLELRNLGETPLKLYPGQTIAQLFFHTIESSNLPGDELGQYSGGIDLIPKRVSSSNTHRKLISLIEQNVHGPQNKS